MKDFAKSIRTMNSNKEEIIKKKKEAGATLKVDNGQKLEFSDGTTYVKTSFSDDYREAHNHVGNKAIVLKDGDVWVVLYANETKSKEFDSEAEAREFAKQVGNSKVGNAQKLYSDANVEIYDDGMVKLTQFPGYTQWAKDVDSIVRDEIRSLEKQISDLKNAANKVKEVGKKYGLL